MSKFRLAKSFFYAAEGVVKGAKFGRNFRIQSVAGLYCLALSPFFLKTRGEWFAVLILVVLILALELFNTAIERLCDFIHSAYHSNIKIIKDLSAGAVLVASIGAAVIGLIIFTSPEGFTAFIEFSKMNLWYPAALILFLIPSAWFIFKK